MDISNCKVGMIVTYRDRDVKISSLPFEYAGQTCVVCKGGARFRESGIYAVEALKEQERTDSIGGKQANPGCHVRRPHDVV